jgi:hypothetical protein
VSIFPSSLPWPVFFLYRELTTVKNPSFNKFTVAHPDTRYNTHCTFSIHVVFTFVLTPFVLFELLVPTVATVSAEGNSDYQRYIIPWERLRASWTKLEVFARCALKASLYCHLHKGPTGLSELGAGGRRRHPKGMEVRVPLANRHYHVCARVPGERGSRVPPFFRPGFRLALFYVAAVSRYHIFPTLKSSYRK